MINSYSRLERDYMFAPEEGLAMQHQKMIEEFMEVVNEAVIIPEQNRLYFTTTLTNYVHEIQDLILACNNQLLRMEDEYGEEFMKRTMTEWDKKIESYKDVKYNVTK
ncbi:MAG: hypothetical protein ACRCX7_11225 [Cetobacterium sp.]|uniref:hypothetical protein n=1 Tax=Cetobacterium sp. TaxID=2071632 RepID=UPI003F335D9F